MVSGNPVECLYAVSVLGVVTAGDDALREVENIVIKSIQLVLCATDSAVLLVEVTEHLVPELAVGEEDGDDVLGGLDRRKCRVPDGRDLDGYDRASSRRAWLAVALDGEQRVAAADGPWPSSRTQSGPSSRLL